LVLAELMALTEPPKVQTDQIQFFQALHQRVAVVVEVITSLL
jgi:hypothetical protein